MIASRTTDFRFANDSTPRTTDDGKFSRGKSSWKFSLRSTPKDEKKQNEKMRRVTGKENSITCDQNSKNLKSNSTGDKKAATKMSNSSTKNPENGKEEVAKKAKTRFLENLYKFQKGSKPSGFDSARNAQSYRSYRKAPSSIQQQQNSGFSNNSGSSFRRSFRTTNIKPGQKSATASAVGQPLSNKELVAERIAKLERKSSTEENSVATSRPRDQTRRQESLKEETEQTERNLDLEESESFPIRESRHTLSSTSSSSTMTSESSQPRVATDKKQSRAELAMERHKERMRKGLQVTPPSSKPSFVSRTSLTPSNKLHTQAAVDKESNLTLNRYTSQQSNSALPHVTAKPHQKKSNDFSNSYFDVTSLTSPTFDFMDDSPLSAVIESLTREPTGKSKKSSKVKKSPVTSPSYKSINIIEDNVFEPAELSTPIKTPVESKVPTTFDDSLYLTPAGTNQQRTTNGSNKLQPINKPIPIVLPSTPATEAKVPLSAYYTPSEVPKKTATLPEVFDLKIDDKNIKRSARKSKVDLDKTKGKADSQKLGTSSEKTYPSLSKRSTEIESNINYSAEEAIDTFRRLSEEIDTIKTRGFRQSLVDTPEKADSKSAAKVSDTLPSVLEIESEVIQIKTPKQPGFEYSELYRKRKSESEDKPKNKSDNLASEKLFTLKNKANHVLPGSISQQNNISAKSGSFGPGSASQANAKNERGEERGKKGSLSNSFRLPSNDYDTVFTVSSADDQNNKESRFSRSKSESNDKLDNSTRNSDNKFVRPPNKKSIPDKTEIKAEDNNTAIKTNIPASQEARLTTNKKMSVSVRGSFRQMTLEEKRRRLRIAAQKYANDSSTDDNESVLSEGSSSDSDVDSSWLDAPDKDVKPKSYAPAKTVSNINDKKALDHSSQNGLKTQNTSGNNSKAVDIGDMKSMWETKLEEKVNYSQAPEDLGVITKKISERKVERSPSPEVLKEPSLERKESVKVGSMLSMWENRKAKQQTAYDANEDDALQEARMGRLQGAKALFENMGKSGSSSNGVEERNNKASTNGQHTPPRSGAINQTKSIFENLNRSQSLRPTPSPRKSTELKASVSVAEHDVTPIKREAIATKVTRSAVRRPSSVYSSSEYDSEEATLSSESSSDDEQETTKVTNAKSMWERRLSQTSNSEKTTAKPSLESLLKSDSQAGDDISASDVSNASINDVKNAWEEKVSKRSRDMEVNQSGHYGDNHETREVEEKIESEVPVTSHYSKSPKIQRKSTGKSTIQSKISARKKRGRRSMTQPITGEDVNSAKELILEQKTPDDQESEKKKEEGSDEEEVPLSFSERLTFFNKLCRQVPVSPVKRFPTRSRGSNKRFNTQPVDVNEVHEAKLKFGEVIDRNKFFDESSKPPTIKTTDSSPKKSTTKTGDLPPVNRPTRLSVNSSDLSRSNSQSSEEESKKSLPKDSISSSKDSEKEEPRKIGKLSPSLLNFNFPEANQKSAKPKTPPSPRRKLRSPSPLAEEKENNCESDDSSEMGKHRETVIKSTGSIQDRLRKLNNNNEGWKKNVNAESKPIKSTLGDRVNKLKENGEKWKEDKTDTNDLSKIRNSSVGKANISDRLNSILANSTTWKTKTGKQNDAEQFTVQGKRSKREGGKMLPILSSPSLKRRVLPVLPTKAEAVTVDDVTEEQEGHGLSKLSEVLKLSQKGLERDVVKNVENGTTVVPEMVDDDFKNFFTATTINIEHIQVTNENGNVNEEDSPVADTDPTTWFQDNEIEMANPCLTDLGHLKAGVQRQSTRRKRSRNPVKALAAREDVKDSYTEHRSNVGTLEQQRMATRFGGSNFTSAALAGLATKADFSKVSLRNTKKTQAFSASDLQPWQSKMLLRAKGRRKIQTRLVEPSSKSLNSGDAFLLILPNSLFAWFGEFCNIIEKAKIQEIADYIIHQGDMGSKATSLTTFQENVSSSSITKEFWEHLNGKTEFTPSGGCEEDELFEANAQATAKTYKMIDSKLVPDEQSWGKLPTMGMLETNDTYVFDFGAEMYIWQGKEVSFENRQLAVKMARALWDQGYDYTEAGFCPFVSTTEMTTNLKGPRPSWGLFARVNENLETALLQEKFEDWSNIHREIGEREQALRETSRGDVASEMNLKASIKPDLTACDVHKMKKEKAEAVPLKLEGHSILRGHGHMYDSDGRGLTVVTSSVQTWHATDKEKKLLEDSDVQGVFYRGETYVVQWKYIVSSTGKWSAAKSTENLKKTEAKGRERVAYFLWAGSDSTINEKGASAIMATEIDKEGAQIVMCHGKDPPALRQCFNGSMIVIDGKQDNREGFYSWKLYSVSGDYAEETTLYQVPCDAQSLRSKASFIALNGRLAKVIVWHGCKSTKLQRELAENAGKKLQERKQLCMGFRRRCGSVDLSICVEGEENSDFLEGFGRVRRTKYLSLVENFSEASEIQTRAWHLSPSGDKFVARELHPVSQYENDDGDVLPGVYPLLQVQLHDLPKPALVLLENEHCVYIWQGNAEPDMKGSAKRQLDINKRLSMETAIKYCKEYREECTPMFIYQNHEPLEFTNSFFIWKLPKQKISFDEKRSKKPTPIPKILETLSRLIYTLDELRATPLPEGVDPNHLETYLSAEDFEKLFEMKKEQFYELPPWKQNNLRKEKNLF